jgi:NitT/TauT family transport system ATP-binding protein
MASSALKGSSISSDEMNEALVGIWERERKTGIFITHSIREAVFLSDRVLVMTGRPSSIALDLAVPFPRPRRPEIQETAEFGRLCGLLKAKIEAGYGRTRAAA